MTEKRYEYWKNSDTFYDTEIKYGQYFRILDKKEVVELLNALHEENRLLQMKYDAQRELYSQLNSDYNNLHEENRAVKDIIIDLDKSGEFWDRDTLIKVIKSIANELGVDLND